MAKATLPWSSGNFGNLAAACAIRLSYDQTRRFVVPFSNCVTCFGPCTHIVHTFRQPELGDVGLGVGQVTDSCWCGQPDHVDVFATPRRISARTRARRSRR